MLIGYARVSTGDQNLDLQTDDLTRAGCQKIVTDKLSGAKDDRPGLSQVLEQLCAGDTLIVWRLDRLGRSLSHLISVTTGLEDRGLVSRVCKRESTPQLLAASWWFTSSGRWPSSSVRSFGSVPKQS